MTVGESGRDRRIKIFAGLGLLLTLAIALLWFLRPLAAPTPIRVGILHSLTGTVASAPGVGSAFTLTLPIGLGAKPAAAILPEGLKNLHTLVVDDNATARQILRDLLEGWHLRIEEAESGEAALDALHRAAAAGIRSVLSSWIGGCPGSMGWKRRDGSKRTRSYGRRQRSPW
jgi:hypothetical protein